MKTIELQELKESAKNLGTHKGYPMYFTRKHKEGIEAEITLADIEDHKPGEVYYFFGDEPRIYYLVTEITEQRPAAGRHPQPTTFFRLKCEII